MNGKITDEEIFRVHMLNIVTGILMILIGAILVWILIALGVMVTLTHIMQMLI